MTQAHRSLFVAAIGAIAALLSCPAWADGERIAVFTKNQTNPFFLTVRLGADAAARQLKATVVHYIPTKADSIPEQISQIEDVIVKRPSAVVLTPVDFKALNGAIRKLNEANIPVVNMTDRAEQGKFVNFVGAADYDLGLATGRYLLRKLGGQGNVVILEGVKGAVVPNERLRGYKDALKEFPNVKVLASQTANNQRLQAVQVTENLLQANPKIDGILAVNDAMATGAIEALDGANRKALVVGINGTREAVEAIKAGKMLASGDYNAFQHGCFAVMSAVRSLRGQPVPKEIAFPARVIDSSNFQSLDMAPEKMSCLPWESVVK
ncbi:sugar ABC transporter substrate-binding protein [Cupriavidus sp. TMH.W2]|uniref:sugar ABC transporter substrate-binding protein n=1 Tax=Cupriavidus sp. TMH.W2 TaxID=3434465 RepID=UPI003D77C496